MASHYRAGEITYAYVSGRTYKITVNTYTDPTSRADPNTASVYVYYGDGEFDQVFKSYSQPINSYIKKNVYEITHTYKSDGYYTMSLTDPNRVDGIKNINGGDSKNVPFYVETEIYIDGGVGVNQSPVLLVPPIDRGCGGFMYVHNPGAYDPDGDSLTYELIPPKQATGLEVPNYTTPDISPGGTLSIGYNTGELVWNTPIQTGVPLTYNIAIKITEWRGKKIVGYVVRDMQIRIENCQNRPPVIEPMPNYCVEAGKTIQFNVTASDPDFSQLVHLEGFGAPFSNTAHAATLNPPTPVGNPVSAQFSWLTACTDIRYEKYQALIKATDNYLSNPLSDIRFSSIRVIGPPPLNVRLKQINNGFLISWRRDTCKLASYYKIYKRIDSSHWNPDQCFTGVPQGLFTLLDTVNSLNNANDTSIYDDNGGEGLSPLVSYCYRIVAVYPPRAADGKIIFSKTSDSYASEEVCGVIIRSKPIITRVSVINTDAVNGHINLRWLRPDTLDTAQFTPPYRLIFKRAIAFNGSYTAFDSMTFAGFHDITDSSLIDSMINTAQSQYFYKIEFNSITPGNPQFIDVSPVASSVRAGVYATDHANILSWSYKVPWTNDTFVVYRRNISDVLDSIGYSTGGNYRDTGLVNGQNYCYVIKSLGAYSSTLLPLRLENLSQEVCGTPIDTIRPCAPPLALTPPCNSFNTFHNELDWAPDPSCDADVVQYKIYYKRLNTDPYHLLQTVDRSATHYSDTSSQLLRSIAGCYVVTGVDSAGNESNFTNEVCTDNCPEYRIPNVFTPEGDSKNDLLNPFPYRFVDRIDLSIYNRWGLPVFSTTDLDINWNGKDQRTGVDCSDGVYFYICDVYEIFLEGVKKRTIRGTIQIIR